MSKLDIIVKKAGELDNLMFNYVVELATEHLKARPHLNSFVMGMGGFFFTYADGYTVEIDGEELNFDGRTSEYDKRNFYYQEDDLCHELDKFMNDYGYEHKIAGMPIKIVRQGTDNNFEHVYDW